MVKRPFSELGIGVVWARSASVPSGNRYSTEAIFVLDKKHTNIMVIVRGPIRRQLCVGAPYHDDDGRVQTRRELRDTTMYLPPFTLTSFFPFVG